MVQEIVANSRDNLDTQSEQIALYRKKGIRGEGELTATYTGCPGTSGSKTQSDFRSSAM